MDLRVDDTVLFGPPGKSRALGTVVRQVGSKVRIRQHGSAHGQPAGTEWNVPATSDYLQIMERAEPKRKVATKPKRTSRPDPPPARRSSRQAVPRVEDAGSSRAAELSSHRETIDLAYKLLRQWGITDYKVVFSNKFTRRMGQCDFRHREIAYSAPLWPLASPEQRRQTTIHEVAHAVARERHPKSAPHGKEWKAQMVAMGASPTRTHNVNRESIKRTRSDTVAMTCCGGQAFRVTLKKVQVLMTRKSRCSSCGLPPEFATSADRAAYEAWANPGLSIRPNSCTCRLHSLECGLVSR